MKEREESEMTRNGRMGMTGRGTEMTGRKIWNEEKVGNEREIR